MVLAFLAVLAINIQLYAADQVVINNADAGAGSLRQAIADVTDGGTITFNLATGTETIVISSELLITGKGVSINGSNIAGSGISVTVQVTTPGTSPYRGFRINALDKTINISNMNVKGGKFTGTGYLVNVFGQKIIELSDQVLDHILPGSIVLFYSGFDLYYNQKEYFLSYPVLSESTAMLLVKKKVKMIGIDSPSPDYHPYTIHNILLTNNILILENLTNLSSLLPYREFEIMAFPLKIRADSSPVRVVARVTK
jgi:hypothetical protein